MTHSPIPTPLVFVAGPFPPPVHGLAVVNRYIAQTLSAQAAVECFDVAGSTMAEPSLSQRLRRTMTLAATLVRLGRSLIHDRPKALVIGSSAGGAMLFDAAVSLLAMMARVPVFVYHHSFAYLHAPTTRWYHRLGLRLMRGRRHIVLCECMGNALTRQHGVGVQRITVVSNAAYVPPLRVAADERLEGRLCLGFLSSVAANKGILEFLDLAARLREQGYPVTALIAGALDESIASRFHRHLAQFGEMEYIGAVADGAKAEFFRRIDLLVLPSRHIHEAEPLVVIESLANEVPVLATPRGCLPSVWKDDCAVHLVEEANFVDRACVVLAPWLASPDVRAHWSKAAGQIHRSMHASAQAQLGALVRVVCG